MNASVCRTHPTPLASEADYRTQARQWFEDNFPVHWRPNHQDYIEPDYEQQRRWERSLYEAGYAGVAWPKEYGGQGLSLVEYLVCCEEFGRFGIPDSLNAIGKDIIGPLLLAIGSEEQKKRFLPRILTMEDIWCQGFSEVEAGSDLSGVKTRAQRDQGGWVVTGSKIWTSFAHKAQWCLLLARTGDPAQRYDSLSLLIVPMNAKGITVRQINQIDGRANFSEVHFQDVRVNDDGLLGGVNEGWKAAGRVLSIERAINRMYRASLFENELKHLIAACRDNVGLAPLLDDTVYRQRIAKCYEDIEVLRRIVRHTVLMLSQGGEIHAVGSLIKLHWSETHQRIVALAREMLAHAQLPTSKFVDRAIKRFNTLYLRSRAETIQAGSSEVQLDIIADRILMLPKK